MPIGWLALGCALLASPWGFVRTAAAGPRTAAPEGTVRVKLADGTPVTVMRDPDEDAPHAYRYLPANLTISRRGDGPPEFSFLPYRKDEGEELDGALMHVLLRWGLSPSQEAELQRALRHDIDSLGSVVGAASVQAYGEGASWEITSRGAIGSILNRSLASAGNVPTVPGNKLAISFRFDGHDASRIAEALRSRRGAWGEKIRFLFTLGDVPDTWKRDRPDWVLESDLGSLLPRSGG